MSGPFEQAWMLLKNAMDYGEIASELPEPTIQQSLDANMDNPNNKLKEMLEQARNQGPAPSANLKRVQPARPPVRSEHLASFNPPLTSGQFETPQSADKRMEMEDDERFRLYNE